MEQEQKEKIKRDPQIVYVGKKDFSNYLLAVQQILNNGYKLVHVISRGMFTSRAIDIATHKMNSHLLIKDVKIGAEEFFSEEKKRNIRVSTIDITLEKNPNL